LFRELTLNIEKDTGYYAKHQQIIQSLNLCYELNCQPFIVLMKTQIFNLLQTVL